MIDTTCVYFTMASDCLVTTVRQEQHVVVFSFDDNSMSRSINGNQSEIEFKSEYDNAYKLALSSDGSVVAIGNRKYDLSRG